MRSSAVHPGLTRPARRLKGPELPVFGAHQWLLAEVGFRRVFGIGQGSPGNPGLHLLQLDRGQAAHRELFLQLGRRHLLGKDAPNQQTLLRFTGNDGGARLPPFQHTLSSPQVQTGFLAPAAVTRQTLGSQNRRHHFPLAHGGRCLRNGRFQGPPGHPRFNPAPNDVNRARFQRRRAHRHAAGADQDQQPTLQRLVGDHHRTRVSSGQNPIQGLQRQSPLTRLVTVTLQAMLLKDGQDVGFEAGRRRLLSRQGQDPHSHQNRDEQSPPQSRINPFELQDFLLPSHTPSPFLTDTSTDGIDEYNTAPPCWLAHDRDDLSVKYRGAICSFGCQQHRWQSMGPGKARETILCSRRARASHPFVPDRHRPVQPEAQWCNHAPALLKETRSL